MTPVLPVEENRYGLPRLMNHLRSIRVKQARLEAVQQARGHGVVAGIAQDERLILRVGAVIEECGGKRLAAIERLGAQLHGFLRHIQRVVANETDGDALADQLRAVYVVILHVAFARRFAVLPIDGVLKGNAAGLVDVRACRKHTVFFIP